MDNSAMGSNGPWRGHRKNHYNQYYSNCSWHAESPQRYLGRMPTVASTVTSETSRQSSVNYSWHAKSSQRDLGSILTSRQSRNKIDDYNKYKPTIEQAPTVYGETVQRLSSTNKQVVSKKSNISEVVAPPLVKNATASSREPNTLIQSNKPYTGGNTITPNLENSMTSLTDEICDGREVSTDSVDSYAETEAYFNTSSAFLSYDEPIQMTVGRNPSQSSNFSIKRKRKDSSATKIKILKTGDNKKTESINNSNNKLSTNIPAKAVDPKLQKPQVTADMYANNMQNDLYRSSISHTTADVKRDKKTLPAPITNIKETNNEQKKPDLQKSSSVENKNENKRPSKKQREPSFDLKYATVNYLEPITSETTTPLEYVPPKMERASQKQCRRPRKVNFNKVVITPAPTIYDKVMTIKQLSGTVTTKSVNSQMSTVLDEKPITELNVTCSDAVAPPNKLALKCKATTSTELNEISELQTAAQQALATHLPSLQQDMPHIAKELIDHRSAVNVTNIPMPCSSNSTTTIAPIISTSNISVIQATTNSVTQQTNVAEIQGPSQQALSTSLLASAPASHSTVNTRQVENVPPMVENIAPMEAINSSNISMRVTAPTFVRMEDFGNTWGMSILLHILMEQSTKQLSSDCSSQYKISREDIANGLRFGVASVLDSRTDLASRLLSYLNIHEIRNFNVKELIYHISISCTARYNYQMSAFSILKVLVEITNEWDLLNSNGFLRTFARTVLLEWENQHTAAITRQRTTNMQTNPHASVTQNHNQTAQQEVPPQAFTHTSNSAGESNQRESGNLWHLFSELGNMVAIHQQLFRSLLRQSVPVQPPLTFPNHEQSLESIDEDFLQVHLQHDINQENVEAQQQILQDQNPPRLASIKSESLSPPRQPEDQ